MSYTHEYTILLHYFSSFVCNEGFISRFFFFTMEGDFSFGSRVASFLDLPGGFGADTGLLGGLGIRLDIHGLIDRTRDILHMYSYSTYI